MNHSFKLERTLEFDEKRLTLIRKVKLFIDRDERSFIEFYHSTLHKQNQMNSEAQTPARLC